MARKYASDDAKLNTGSIFTRRISAYSDINMLFEANPATGDIYKVKDAAAVKQSVRNLIMTSFLERPFQPSVGSNLRKLLFENITPFVLDEAESYIREAIKNNEPRAVAKDINISSDENELIINLVFQVKESGQIIETTITLERLR
jgi:phage baseplate assembly protein W